MSVRSQTTATLWVAAATTFGWWLAGSWLKPPASPALPRTESPRPPAPASQAASRRQHWINTITGAATPSAQLAAALALARQVDPADFPELLKIVRALPGDSIGSLLQRAVLHRWLQHDPAAALAYAETQNEQLLSETIGEWARMEPSAAIAWFNDAPLRLKTESVIWALAMGVAPGDPEAALEVVKSMPRSWLESTSRTHGPTLIALFEIMAGGNPGKLLENTKSLPEELVSSARIAAAGLIARHDLTAFLRWAHAQPDRPDLLKMGLLDRSIPSDQAIAAMASLSPDDQAGLAMRAYPFRWGFDGLVWWAWPPSDPWAALRQVESTTSFHPELRERLIDQFARSDAFQADPTRAVAELTRIAPDLRSEWADTLVGKWALKDPEAARAWAATVPETEGGADMLKKIDDILRPTAPVSPSSPMEEIIRGFFTGSSEQRMEVLQAYARPPVEMDLIEREQVQRAALRIMEFFPSEAAPWLATRPQDEPTTVNQASMVAAHWAREEPMAAADWSAQLPAGRARTWALWNAAAEFHRLDPTGARAWAEALPDPALRAVATQAFAGQRPEP